MAYSRVSKRYAKSLIGLATERNELDAAFKDMEFLLATIDANHDLKVMLSSPVINVDKKLHILDMVFGGSLNELSNKFIKLITEKGRESQLRNIAKDFVSQYKASKGINTATVSSASKLMPDALAKIEAIVKEYTGGTVELTESVDPDLIGGFVLRIGDMQLDTSIQNKLNDLRNEFDTNLYERDF
jgi:F-type H+-transporting ATPase subunit delta